MKTVGYSGTPLAKKLGIKEGFNVKLLHAPDYYFDLFSDFPVNVKVVKSVKDKLDFIHYFCTNSEALKNVLPALKKELQPNGMIWVSWYKKSAGIPTDVSEDLIRSIALKIGLVDIKVCAVDEKWSGLKLVIPVKERATK